MLLLTNISTLDQVRRDLDELAELGATHVPFDTYPGTPPIPEPHLPPEPRGELRAPEADQRLLDTLAEHVLPKHAG